MEVLAKNLKRLRKQKGMTQKEMASCLNLSVTGYAYYENNERDPALPTLLKISEILEVSLDTLFDKTPQQVLWQNTKFAILEKLKSLEYFVEHGKDSD